MGTILVLAGATTIINVYKGSKVTFAFIMTTFTCFYGLIFIAMALFTNNYDVTTTSLVV